MPRTRNLVVAACGAAALSISSVATSEDYPSMTFRYGNGLPKALYLTKPDQYFAKKLEEKSGGKIKVRMFFSGAIGKANEMLDLVGKGAVDYGAIVQGYFGSRIPFAAMSNSLPMTFFDGPKILKAAQTVDAKDATVQAELKRNNIKPLVYRYLPNYRLICTKPVKTVADLKGLKIRTFGAYMPKMFNALGATPVNVLPSDMYESLKRGSMDCAYLTYGLFRVFKLHEVAKNIIEVDFGAINAYFMVMNRQRWEKLPPKVKSLVLEAASEATEYGVKITQEAEAAALKAMLDQGARLVRFEEQSKLRDAVPDMQALWIADMKKIGKESEARAYLRAINQIAK